MSVEADEACLSVVGEGEGLVVAEATGPRQSERTAGAEAPGSNVETEPPGPRTRTRAEVGMGRRDWSAVAGRLCVMRRRLVSGDCEGFKPGKPGSREASVTSGNPSGQGCPMAGCGRWVTDLRRLFEGAHPRCFSGFVPD